MGNGVTKLTQCFTPDGNGGIRRTAAAVTSVPYDSGLGHSFCYVHPDDPATFLSISGASISANTATALSTDPSVTATSSSSPAAVFESSTSFFSVPLQPIPRFSGPLGFLSGPIERTFLSGPLDHPTSLSRSLSQGGAALRRRYRCAASSLLCRFSRAFRLAPKESDITTNSNTSGRTSVEHTAGEPNLHWAHGKAGEDRVHVVISERGWVFVGIYDGFNGPDATDFLLSNLYSAVQCELKGLHLKESFHLSDETHHFDCKNGTFLQVDHTQVLNAMSRALKKTEDAFLNIADKSVLENPELALMGSCVLVMLMRGKDVYLMNVGDSRAILAQTSSEELGSINEKTLNDYGERMDDLRTLAALQISLDHSTCIEEEVRRIKKEHPDDASAIANDRVKGYLKVTRAFGAGFLKQPKWNNALLEMFRIDYVGTSPYLTCNPSLYHHELSPRDRFVILSSDGLYQYLTNEEAVAEVELFIATTPEGDPAQHLVEEVLFRAAKKTGMDFHELLEIPQGDRRRYHDDISILVISLEGWIWRSWV